MWKLVQWPPTKAMRAAYADASMLPWQDQIAAMLAAAPEPAEEEELLKHVSKNLYGANQRGWWRSQPTAWEHLPVEVRRDVRKEARAVLDALKGGV